MLILIVLTCIFIWYGVKRYKRSRDLDGLLPGEEMSLREEIREIVLKYKYFILIGSTLMTIGSIGWMYYMFYVPYVHHEDLVLRNAWQFGTQVVWARHFESSVQKSHKDIPSGNDCEHFSKDRYIYNMKMLKNYTNSKTSEEILSKLLDNRSNAHKQMYNTPVKMPVVIVESSIRNFENVQQFVQKSEEKFLVNSPDFKVLIYDMGMDFQQKYVLLNCSQCEVVENFAEGIKSFHWTPVLLYLTLQRFKSAIWVNVSSVSLKKLEEYLHNESQYPGFQINTTAKQNHPSMELKVDDKFHKRSTATEPGLDMLLSRFQCQSNHQASEASVVYSNSSPFTMENIVKPWTLCAIRGDCVLQEQCPAAHSQNLTSCIHDTYVIDYILYSVFGNAAPMFYN